MPIAPSTYYEMKARERDPNLLPKQAQRDAELRPEIQRVWDENRQVYGARKVWKQMNREDIPVARCTVQRLMRTMGLRGEVRGRSFKTTVADEAATRPADLVDRNFTVEAPNRLWVSDLTYVRTWQGFVNIDGLLDLGPGFPKGLRWEDLSAPQMEGDRLEAHYRKTLETLGKSGGLLGIIFRKAQNRIQDPAKLRQLIVELVGKQTWTSMSSDVKGDAYEGLLEKNAQDTKGGAGQYFTPRSVIQAMVDCVQPQPGEVILDPACGTGGFLLAAHDYIAANTKLDKSQKKHLKYKALQGVELVDNVTRLCAMNLFLHGIGPNDDEMEPPIRTDDSLRNEPKDHVDVVLTNPPFGKKSSITVVNEKGEEDRQSLTYNRADFWTTTSNKQLNFVQHVKSLLKIHGRAAMVVPDNVLFEGGAGETVRRKLLHECDVHTLLRLPTGIFYAQGVKANVLFFDRKPASEKPWTKTLWVYDHRTNKHYTLKERTLTREDLDEFVACYKPGNRHTRKATWSEEKPEGRWRSFPYDDLIARDKVSLDLFWLRDESLEDSAHLPDPDELAEEIAEDLRAALEQIEEVLEDLRERRQHS